MLPPAVHAQFCNPTATTPVSDSESQTVWGKLKHVARALVFVYLFECRSWWFCRRCTTLQSLSFCVLKDAGLSEDCDPFVFSFYFGPLTVISKNHSRKKTRLKKFKFTTKKLRRKEILLATLHQLIRSWCYAASANTHSAAGAYIPIT